MRAQIVIILKNAHFQKNRSIARASFNHIEAILFRDWRGEPEIKRVSDDAGIIENRFASGRPPIRNLKERTLLHQFLRNAARKYPDISCAPSLDLAAKIVSSEWFNMIEICSSITGLGTKMEKHAQRAGGYVYRSAYRNQVGHPMLDVYRGIGCDHL